MSSTRISRRVNAPRAAVYRAMLDARGREVDGANEVGWRMSLDKLAGLVEGG